MKLRLIIALLLIANISFAQSWTPINGKQRFNAGLGLPVKDSSYFTGDTSLIYIGLDSNLYYKRRSYNNLIITKTYLNSRYLDSVSKVSNFRYRFYKNGLTFYDQVFDTSSLGFATNYNVSANYVPYIGATKDIDVGTHIITAGSIKSTYASPGSVVYINSNNYLYQDNGNLFWDDTQHFLGLGLNGSSPKAKLDVHGTDGILAQLNGYSNNSSYLNFQSNFSSKWKIGNYYNAASNDFVLFDSVNSIYRLTVKNNGQTFFNNSNPIGTTLTNRSAIWNTWDGLSGNGNAILNNVTYAGSGGATPAFTGYKANGTISAPTALLTSNVISQYTGYGYDGTDFYLGASIYHYAASNWTSSSHETGVKIQLVPSGSAATPSTYHTFTTLGLSASGTITANSNGAPPLTGYGLLNIYPGSSYSPTSMLIAAGLCGNSMTITDSVTAASGTVFQVPTHQVQGSTYTAANTGVTYTNASTLYIGGAPTASTNVTITNPYALYINTGLSKFSGFTTDKNVNFGSTTFPSGSNAKININAGAIGANTTTLGVHLALGANTYTDNSTAASGTASFATVASIAGQTFIASNTGVTYTNAASLYIGAAPIAGTNATITNSYAIYLAAGQSFFRGFYNIGNTVFGGSSATTSSNAKINISGAVTGANTLTNGVHFLSAQNSYTDNTTAASGTAAWVVGNSFQGIVAAASNTSVTYTNAATVYIEGNPIAGTNATITNGWNLYANTGNTRLAGLSVNVGSDATGDLLYRASTGLLARLGIGSTGSFLTVSGGLPAWSSSTLTLGGNLTTSGAFATTLTTTATTALTLPSSGTVLAANTPSALTAGATITLTPSPIATSFTLNVGANATSTFNMGTIPSSVVGSDIDVSITSTTTSCVITFGTSFKSQGTLTTGATSGKIFHIKFHVVSTSQVDEVSRTIAM